MRYLGIDYGLRKMGLAISDGIIASPLKVVTINNLQDAVTKINQVIKDQAIEEVVIGIPESGVALKAVKQLIKILQKDSPVHEVAETLSSQQAQTLMKQLNVKKKQAEDSFAAAIILQNYLECLS